jgi:hypothetical protein
VACAGLTDTFSLSVGRRGARFDQFSHLSRFEPIREGELSPAPAFEGGPPGEPHRQRIAHYRPLPAPPTRQHNIPRRSVHATPFVRWRHTESHTDALRATWIRLDLALHLDSCLNPIYMRGRATHSCNTRSLLWYGGVAGDGLRSVGEDFLPSSKSVCSILPITRRLRAGALGHLDRPASCYAKALLPAAAPPSAP